MADLKIRVFKGADTDPETTVTIPGSILKLAARLIPKKAMEALQAEGIDLDELVELSNNPEVKGTIVEIDEHKKNEKIVISIEQ
jgi:hypothetical protein